MEKKTWQDKIKEMIGLATDKPFSYKLVYDMPSFLMLGGVLLFVFLFIVMFNVYVNKKLFKK